MQHWHNNTACDNQHYGTQYNDIQHGDTQHDDTTQHATLSIITPSIMTPSMMTLSTMVLRITTLKRTTLSIMTGSICQCSMCVIMPTLYTEYHYAGIFLFMVMQSVFILGAIMPSVVVPSGKVIRTQWSKKLECLFVLKLKLRGLYLGRIFRFIICHTL